MRKIYKAVTLVSLTLAMLPTMIVPVMAEPLRIGVGNYPPFISNEGASGRVGIEAELLDEICARGAFDCVYEQMELSVLLSAVASGDIDLAAGGIGTSVEREQLVDFTCPYALFGNPSAVVWALDKEIQIESARIAVVHSSLNEKALIRMGLNALPFADDRAAMIALRSGNADAYFSGGEFAKGGQGLVAIGELEVDRTGAAFAVSESNPELRELIDEILSDLSSEGVIGRAQERWLGFSQGDVIADCDKSIAIS